MGALTIFSFMKEEWKCVFTHGVPYFIKGISRNALTNFNSEFFISKQRQVSYNHMHRHQWLFEFNGMITNYNNTLTVIFCFQLT
jgi:hypothetical protein